MKKFMLGIAACVMLHVAASPASADPPSPNIYFTMDEVRVSPHFGYAKAIDGDTLILNGVHIRLWGIDAYELDQTCTTPTGEVLACGQISRSALQQFINGRSIMCWQRDIDRYQRIVASCAVPISSEVQDKAIDLAAMMVTYGYALDAPRYSHGHYHAHEKWARDGMPGPSLAKTQHVSPETWRRTHSK